MAEITAPQSSLKALIAKAKSKPTLLMRRSMTTFLSQSQIRSSRRYHSDDK